MSVRASLLPLVAAAVGLVGLAALEYRWTDQLARAEEARLRATLDAGARRFAEDLDRELGRLLSAYRPRPWGEGGPAERCVQQREDWAAQALEPGLLRAVYIARESAGDWGLERCQASPLGLVPEGWTPELEPVRRRLADEDPFRAGPPDSPLVPEVPALMVGLRPALRGGGRGADDTRPAVFVLVLDRQSLAAGLLPALSARHFAGLDCTVVVRQRPGGEVLFSSDPQGAAPASPEVRLALFPLLGPEERRMAMRGGGPHTRPDGPHGPPRLPPSPWELQVSPRAGSLAAAGAAVRTRNLALGLGALVLVAGSAALIALSAHRAQALARQQVAFVAAVSHELRTPLAAVCSAGQNLADGVVSEPAQVRRYGEVVRQEGLRLTALVEHVLELAGLLARGRSLQLEEVAVGALVEDALRDLGPAAAEVARAVPPGLPPLAGDPALLRSALRNLVDNALRHGGGAVTVRAEEAPGPRGSELRITVADQGPGLPVEGRERLFTPFHRGEPARSRRIPGHGLGLSIVRQVAEAHGGRVTVSSGEGGRGARFTLHLPAAAREGGRG